MVPMKDYNFPRKFEGVLDQFHSTELKKINSKQEFSK